MENHEGCSDESGEAEQVEIVDGGSQEDRDLIKQFNEYFSNTDLVNRLMADYNDSTNHPDSLTGTVSIGKSNKKMRPSREENERSSSQNTEVLVLEDNIQQRPRSGDDGAKQTEQLISNSSSSSSHGRPYNKDI